MSPNERDTSLPEEFTPEQELHQKLCAYVLGELDESDRAEVEAALDASEELRAEREQLEATIGLVQTTLGEGEGATRGEALSQDAQSRLAFEARRSVRASRPWYTQGAWRAAAGFLIVLGGVAMWRANQNDGQHALMSEMSVAKNENRAELTEDESRMMADLGYVESATEEDLRSLEALGYVDDENGFAQARSSGKEQAGQLASSREAPEEHASAGLRAKVDAPDSKGLAEAEAKPGGLDRSLGRDSDGEKDGLVVYSYEKANVDFGDSEISQEAAGEQPFSANEPASAPALVGAVGGQDPNESVDHVLSQMGYVGDEATAEAHRGLATSSAPGPSSPGSSAAKSPPSPARPSPKLRVETGSDDFFLGEGEAASSRYRHESSEQRLGWTDALGATGANRPETDSLGLYYRFQYEGGDDRARRSGGFDDRDADAYVRSLFQDCIRRPNERPRDMFFRFWGDNPFVFSHQDPLATLSVDVDTASYALVRNYLRRGTRPPKEAVRTEEFVNYLKPDVPAPTEDTFAIHTELAPSRFAPSEDHWMLRVVLRGKEVAKEERQPLTLMLVLDCSGSMKEENRLELVKHGIRLLVGEMDARDSIGIVAFSREARVILPLTSAADRGVIDAALFGLNPNGGTNAEAGLKLGYELMLRDFTENTHNRIVLLSDGVANIGQTDQNRLGDDVRSHRERGIYLNTIGVGMGNHNDAFLEQLANRGDGICNYIDTPLEARRALVDNFMGAFETIARDVKLQVEFDPSQVHSYRQLGYENRRVADADFRNDAVDAGEVGAGHQVVALFELRRTTGSTDTEQPIATVRARWKPPHGPKGADPELEIATEIVNPVQASDALGSYDAASPGYRRSVVAAQFAESLRRSVHARGDSFQLLLAEGKLLAAQESDPDFIEMVELMKQSATLIVRDARHYDDLARAVDEVRRRAYLRAQVEDLELVSDLKKAASEVERLEAQRDAVRELEKENAELEARIRELLKAKLEGSRESGR